MIILIRMSTGEDWPTIMFDTMYTKSDCIPGVNCGVSYAPVFFISFVMVCSYVMLNLFIMIIIQQFEMYYLPEDNILQKFRDDLEAFKATWQGYSKEYEGAKIRAMDLVSFFKDLKGNLGMHGETDKVILRNCVKMNLDGDEEGFVYFNELLFKTMKRIYGSERTKKKILADIEFHALDKLQQIKAKIMARTRKTERFKAVILNPFLAVMYKNMSFHAWVKQYTQNLQRRQDEREHGLERESSDEEYTEKNENNAGDYEYVTEGDMSVNEEDFQELLADENVVVIQGVVKKKTGFMIKLKETATLPKNDERQRENNVSAHN